MQLNFKNYQRNQTKLTLKKNNFLLLALGANQNSQNWITLEQNIHKLGFSYTKTYNNITTKIFQDSIAKKLKGLINSTFFLLKPKKINGSVLKVIKSNITNSINSSKFTIVALKLNKKMYTPFQLKTMNSFHYKKNIAAIYQFLSTALKSTTVLKQK